MNPNAAQLWRAPLWALALLLALLSMVAPFAVDTYLPAFAGMAQSLGATPVQMQQTLSSYLFGYAFMNLFHGALSDSIGRKPVVLAGTALFTLASAGCALSETIGPLVFFRALQGMSTGAGVVVSRAIIRDMFPPAQAQKVMSQVTIYFGIAPAIAPIIGGWLFVHLGWHSIFWLLTLLGLALLVATQRLLPETLHRQARQPFEVGHLLRGYWQLASSLRFLLLSLASGIPFNGMFLYVLSAPAFLGELLALPPTQFFWLFLLNIGGIMLGAWLSGRQAGRWAPKRLCDHAGEQHHQPDCQFNLAGPCELGAAADRRVFFWLGAGRARGHLAGAGPLPRAARHGLVLAGGHRCGGQRHRRRSSRPSRHAFNRGFGPGLSVHAADGLGRLGVATRSLARDWSLRASAAP